MFNLFKKKPTGPPGFGALHTDVHSHLIPGIDDGAPDVDTAVALVTALRDMGFQRLITTPHVMADLYPNTPEIILDGLATLRAALAQAGVDIPVEAAAEYLMDEAFAQKVADGQLLALPGRHVLVEMSFVASPPSLYDDLFRLQAKGYRPIMAHPERYMYLHPDMKGYQRLRDAGCLFQVNLLSLDGYYGRPVQRVAEKLLRQGWVELLGTDLHHQRHADALARMARGGRMSQWGVENLAVR